MPPFRACLSASVTLSLALLPACIARPETASASQHPEPATASTAADPAEADALAGPRIRPSDQPQARVVNSLCPIMEGRSVSESGMCNSDLTRRLSDKTVGFCCSDCLSTWDALSEIEKHLALSRVTPRPIRPEPAPAKPAPPKKPEPKPDAKPQPQPMGTGSP